MTPPEMSRVGEQKGIDLLGTGDFLHPLWLREIKNYLTDAEEGIYKIKTPKQGENEKTRFLLSVEISCIYSQGGKGRRIHNLVLAPSFETAGKLQKELVKRGCNLSSDGRPIIGLSSKQLLQTILEIDERSMIIPCHAWTPWFGIYGQMSGFNSLSEAFEDLAPYVYGIETGLSSDPEMNWQIDELQNRSILSFSDAHSPAKMGREATVFRLKNLTYENIRQAIMRPSLSSVVASEAKQTHTSTKKIATSHAPRNDDINKVLYTIEFYPEEGKYHYSGHRSCGITMTPEEQNAVHNICPVCKRKLTDGVMRRVEELSTIAPRGVHKENSHGLVWIADPKGMHPPYVKIVPLGEIIAESIGSPVASPKVKVIYDVLCKGQSEFEILLKAELTDIAKRALTVTNEKFAGKIAEAVGKVRREQIVIKPGYDGVFGVVKIWEEGVDVAKDTDEDLSSKEQTRLTF